MRCSLCSDLHWTVPNNNSQLGTLAVGGSINPSLECTSAIRTPRAKYDDQIYQEFSISKLGLGIIALFTVFSNAIQHSVSLQDKI